MECKRSSICYEFQPHGFTFLSSFCFFACAYQGLIHSLGLQSRGRPEQCRSTMRSSFSSHHVSLLCFCLSTMLPLYEKSASAFLRVALRVSVIGFRPLTMLGPKILEIFWKICDGVSKFPITAVQLTSRTSSCCLIPLRMVSFSLRNRFFLRVSSLMNALSRMPSYKVSNSRHNESTHVKLSYDGRVLV